MVKKYSLTEQEKSDYFFNFRLMKEYELMAKFWQERLNWTRMEAIKRNAIDPEKFTTNWDKTLEDGTFTAEPKTVDTNKK